MCTVARPGRTGRPCNTVPPRPQRAHTTDVAGVASEQQNGSRAATTAAGVNPATRPGGAADTVGHREAPDNPPHLWRAEKLRLQLHKYNVEQRGQDVRIAGAGR